MKVIAGLGNPGVRYENTRHNAGFMAIDALAEMMGIAVNKEKFSALYGKGKYKGEDYILIKPQTFMNNSGFAIRQVLDYFKVPVEDLLVIYDDIDLPVGSIRLRQKGSAGGHNGMKSIIACVFTSEFDRIRVGVGKDPQVPMVDWVLSRFRPEEKEDLQEAVQTAAKAARSSIHQPFNMVMNRYNKKAKPKKKPEAGQPEKAAESQENKVDLPAGSTPAEAEQ